MLVLKCDVCGIREAVVYQRHTCRALCVRCFINNVTSRVLNEVRRYGMFGSNDRLLLSLSGGKDSYTLLDVISRLHDAGKMGVITIIEGIPNYDRREGIEWILKRSKELGIDVFLTSFKDFLGYTLGEIVERSRIYNVNVSPCTFCGIIRRRIVNKYAREHGFTKVLTAHNLDDEVQTVILNILRGDIARLVQTHPKGPVLSKLFVRKVKPLRKIYEWETAIYSYLIGFRFQVAECPFIKYQPTLRARIRYYLRKLERRRPGTLLTFLTAIDDMVGSIVGNFTGLPELPRCKRCGEPTAYGRDYCVLCELLDKVGLNALPGRKVALC